MIMLAEQWADPPRRSAIPKKVRFGVLKRDGYRCVYCGATARDAALHMDHVIAVANGGTNDAWNLVTACGPCNIGKGINSAEPGGPKFEPVIREDDWRGQGIESGEEYDFVREWDGWEPLL